MGSEMRGDGDDEVVVAMTMAGKWVKREGERGGKEKRTRGDKRRGGRGIGAVERNLCVHVTHH
jgi:hypothetical protein